MVVQWQVRPLASTLTDTHSCTHIHNHTHTRTHSYTHIHIPRLVLSLGDGYLFELDCCALLVSSPSVTKTSGPSNNSNNSDPEATPETLSVQQQQQQQQSVGDVKLAVDGAFSQVHTRATRQLSNSSLDSREGILDTHGHHHSHARTLRFGCGGCTSLRSHPLLRTRCHALKHDCCLYTFHGWVDCTLVRCPCEILCSYLLLLSLFVCLCLSLSHTHTLSLSLCLFLPECV